MFKVYDETSYSIYKDMELESVTLWKKNNWKCITVNGFYLNIIIKGGTLYADLAETELDLGHNAMPIIKYNNKDIKDWVLNKDKQISFEEIKKIMNWTCASDQIWDIE
jgi:hypothetical protein